MATAEQLIEMVKKTDPGTAKVLSDMIANKITKVVRCMSKKHKGKIIANILDDGNVQGTGDELFSSRTRFDGYMGFECSCGNDSRLAEQEKGIIGRAKPTKEDLNKIWERVNKKPKYKENNNKVEIDGFIVENINGL